MTTHQERIQSLKAMNEQLMDVAYIRNRTDRLEAIKRLLRHYPSNVEIDLYFALQNQLPNQRAPK